VKVQGQLHFASGEKLLIQSTTFVLPSVNMILRDEKVTLNRTLVQLLRFYFSTVFQPGLVTYINGHF